MSAPKITKPVLRILERMFALEVPPELENNALPPLYQSKAKILTAMANDKLIEFQTVTLPGRFPVTIEGWVLTHKGRAAYCESRK